MKHGDGEHIHAIIWFCDFRDSTALSESMAQETYLLHLNRFFHCMAGAVIENGGEVLRFIGDAVLAIFPISEAAGDSWESVTGTPEACRRAIKAARMADERIATVNANHPDLPPQKYGIGLHLGDMTYGNIGIPQRLEFTVIGSAANEAARIEGMTKELQKKGPGVFHLCRRLSRQTGLDGAPIAQRVERRIRTFHLARRITEGGRRWVVPFPAVALS